MVVKRATEWGRGECLTRLCLLTLLGMGLDSEEKLVTPQSLLQCWGWDSGTRSVTVDCSAGMCHRNSCWCLRQIMEWVGGRKDGGVDFCDPLGTGSAEKSRLQQVFFYRAGDEIGGFGLEEKQTWRSAIHLPVSQAGVTGVHLLELGAGIKQWAGRGHLGGEWLWEPQGI